MPLHNYDSESEDIIKIDWGSQMKENGQSKKYVKNQK